jgi:hypothetical protein
VVSRHISGSRTVTGRRAYRPSVVGVGALFILLLRAQSAAAFDPGLDLRVDTWTSDTGHAYVGVTASGSWAPPAESRKRVRTEFFSEWQNQGTPNAFCHDWWVFVHRTADGSVVNFDSPVSVVRCGPKPVIGVTPSGFGDLSLYLSVGVAPVTAPAGTERSVTAHLTAGWRTWIDDAIATYVIPESVRVQRWTIDFGDGSVSTFPADRALPDQLTVPHRYATGRFDVVATAHVTGDAFAAFFSPSGVPLERTVPFALDITNRASGVAALPIEYVAPVVTVGASPSGTLPDGRLVGPDEAGHAALWWPRGLHSDLYVRPIIVREGYMRSGGIRIGGSTTRLVSYRYERGVNDASDASATGSYAAEAPIRIQWNTPLSHGSTYPVQLVLELQTTYDDGTVRTSEVSGGVSVTVVYSAVTH